MGPKKSTKKFEKNHLKSTLERRKEGAKIKQRQQLKVKRQARNAADKVKGEGVESGVESGRGKVGGDGRGKERGGKILSEMSVDEFFDGGFEVAGLGVGGGKKRKRGKQEREGRGRDEEGKEEESELDGGVGFGGSDEEDMVVGENDNDGEDDLEEEGGLEMDKGDLEALAEKDPEFYAFLKENDRELLDFDGEEDGGVGLEDGEEAEVEGKKKKKKRKSREEKEETEEEEEVEEETEDIDEEGSEVTLPMVEKWKAAMSDQHSLRATRQAVLAFRAAAYINADDGKVHKYTISTPEVYHELLVTTLKQVPEVLTHHLPPKELSSGKVRIATDSKKFRSLSPLLKSFSASICQLLESLSDAPTIKLTLNALHPLMPYLLSFRKILQDLTKLIVTIWSSTISTSSETTLLTAFLLLRRLFTTADSTLRTAILKLVYLHLIKASRTTNTHTLPTLNILKSTAAELWALDSTVGYTTAFTSIRQLAIHLRGTITKPTKDSHKAIYNWQYIHSLDFWSLVLSLPSSTPPLHPLIYPLTQLTLGTIRLLPTPTFFPLRFHLTRSLLRLSRATTTYIPLAPSLLEILASPDLSQQAKPSTLPPLDFNTVLKAPPAYLRTRTYQDGLGGQVHDLLAEFFACWAINVAFPELIVPPTVAIKRWLKSSSTSPSTTSSSSSSKGKKGGGSRGNSKLHATFSLLLQKLAAQAAFVEKERATVRFAPGMRSEVEGFLRDQSFGEMPLGGYVEGLRVRREERERVLESARERGRGEREKKREREDGE